MTILDDILASERRRVRIITVIWGISCGVATAAIAATFGEVGVAIAFPLIVLGSFLVGWHL